MLCGTLAGCRRLLSIVTDRSALLLIHPSLNYSPLFYNLNLRKKSIRDIILQNSFRFERLVGSKSAIPLKEDNGAAAQSTQNHVTNLHFVILREVSIGLFKIYQGHLK